MMASHLNKIIDDFQEDLIRQQRFRDREKMEEVRVAIVRQKKNAPRQLAEIKQEWQKTDYEFGEEVAKIVLPECPKKPYAGYGFLVASIKEISKFADKKELASLLRELCYAIEDESIGMAGVVINRKIDLD